MLYRRKTWQFRYNKMLTSTPTLRNHLFAPQSEVISFVLFFGVSLELLHADIDVLVKTRFIRSITTILYLLLTVNTHLRRKLQ